MPSEVEERYRQAFLSADIKQTKIGVFLVLVPIVLYLFNDYQFFGLTTTFYELLALRLGLLAFTMWLLIYFGRMKSYRSYDKAVFVWAFVGVTITNLINASRPQNFLFHIIIVIAIVAAAYIIIPQKLVNRVIIASIASIGELLIMMPSARSLETPELFSVTVSLILANIIGFFTARLLESYRFKTFQAQEKIADLARFPTENPDPVLRVSKNNVILYANPAAKRLFGEQEVEVGKPLPGFINIDQSLRGTVEVTHGDKTFLFSAVPRVDADYVNLFGIDITRRKKDEALLVLHETRLQALLNLNTMFDATEKELVDFTLEAIKEVTQSEFAFISLASEDEKVMSMVSWSEMVMKECKTMSEPIHYPTTKAGLWAEPIRQRKPVFINDYSAAMPNKTGLPAGHVPIKRYLGVPVFEKEHIVAMAAVANKNENYNELDARSVTRLTNDMWLLIQRKNSREAMRESARKIEVMNEKLRVSGSLTRHDVRNKLSTVTGYSFLLKKKYADRVDVVDALGAMEQAVKDSVKIFDFAKMYEQLGVEELKYVNVETTVNEAVALFSGLPFKVINDCHGLSLLADSFLRQLFYNFVDNTRKYGAKTTTASIYCKKTEQGKLLLIYEDDGVGISAENKLKLFSEGFSTGGSTGFGLFLIKKMMDVYGWAIQENGEEGKGVKFVITIPKNNPNGRANWQIAEDNNKTKFRSKRQL